MSTFKALQFFASLCVLDRAFSFSVIVFADLLMPVEIRSFCESLVTLTRPLHRILCTCYTGGFLDPKPKTPNP